MRVGRRVGLALIVVLTACSSTEEHVTGDPDGVELDGANIDNNDVCPSWEPYHPYWRTLVIEVGEGPPIGIDAVSLTQHCVGEVYYGEKIEFYSVAAVGEQIDVLFETFFAPDATPANCSDRTLTLTQGDVVGISLQSAFGPGDILDVVVVEPDGTCSAAKMTNHLKLSIADGVGFTVPVGEGTTAIVPPDLPDRVP